jgi:nicotinamidase-related amidase
MVEALGSAANCHEQGKSPHRRARGKANDPESSPIALLLIDVINAFDFADSEGIVQAAERAAPRIIDLRERARSAGMPVIYANDNFGQWRSDFRTTIEACSAPDKPGHRVTRALVPGERDYFVLKPRHSAFYCTALDVLLDRLQVQRLVLVGFATNICVLYSASDAHMRGYDVVVPRDCTASNTQSLTDQALEQMRVVTAASIVDSLELDFAALGDAVR